MPQQHPHDSPDKDKSNDKGNDDNLDDAWDDVLSVLHKNNEEDGDLYLSAAYQESGWEDEQGMILSTNPAWIKLLDNVDTEQELDHRRQSFMSVNSSQKSGDDESEVEDQSRKRSFMTISTAGGSDVVAVKAGETYFPLNHSMNRPSKSISSFTL